MGQYLSNTPAQTIMTPQHYRQLRLTSLCGRYCTVLLVLLGLLAGSIGAPSKKSSTSPRTTRRAGPQGRLTTVDWESYHDREHEGPGSYTFGYDVQDANSGNVQFREESRSPDGTVRGSYGLLEPDGNVRIVHYVADHLGFRVEIENSLKPDEQHPTPVKRRHHGSAAVLPRPTPTPVIYVQPLSQPTSIPTFQYTPQEPVVYQQEPIYYSQEPVYEQERYYDVTPYQNYQPQKVYRTKLV